jgi:hypothetical protein
MKRFTLRIKPCFDKSYKPTKSSPHVELQREQQKEINHERRSGRRGVGWGGGGGWGMLGWVSAEPWARGAQCELGSEGVSWRVN